MRDSSGGLSGKETLSRLDEGGREPGDSLGRLSCQKDQAGWQLQGTFFQGVFKEHCCTLLILLWGGGGLIKSKLKNKETIYYHIVSSVTYARLQ